jgi:hypothetical protein
MRLARGVSRARAVFVHSEHLELMPRGAAEFLAKLVSGLVTWQRGHVQNPDATRSLRAFTTA